MSRAIRDAQDRNGLLAGRLAAQLDQTTIRTARRRRVFAGPLPLPARGVAPATGLEAARLFQQADAVARASALGKSTVGPGPIR